MSLDPINTLSSIRSELEQGWKLFDGIYDGFDERRWASRFGKKWTYAEQPWHLAYFDAMAAKAVADGPNAPENDRMHIRSMGDLDEWNRREFARRKPGHTAQDSITAMRESRAALRALLDGMTDANLAEPAWIPLIFGWGTKGDALKMVIVHNVAEYWKLWIRTGKRAPAPTPSAIHLRLGFMMNFMPATMNTAAAAAGPFRMVWNFDGPGGGAWTFNVADGKCTVSEEKAEKPDLMITMKPENFHRMVVKMASPPVLMLTGQMKIKGFGAMGRFGKLFPEPKPDQIVETSGVAPVG